MKHSKDRNMKRKQAYVVDGVSRDQETILSQKSWIEDYVRDNITSKFSKTKLTWEMTADEQFSFKICFYA